jgi:hypothetical protein
MHTKIFQNLVPFQGVVRCYYPCGSQHHPPIVSPYAQEQYLSLWLPAPSSYRPTIRTGTIPILVAPSTILLSSHHTHRNNARYSWTTNQIRCWRGTRELHFYRGVVIREQSLSWRGWEGVEVALWPVRQAQAYAASPPPNPRSPVTRQFILASNKTCFYLWWGPESDIFFPSYVS